MASPLGNVEVSLPFGGDFVMTSNGDLQIINDIVDNGLATMQRIERGIMQCATLRDASGNAIARADDIFNPNEGAGGRRVVGKLITDDLINQMKSQILAWLSTDPSLVQNPPPSVTVQDGGNGTLILGPISATTIIGQVVTVPSRRLQVLGANG